MVVVKSYHSWMLQSCIRQRISRIPLNTCHITEDVSLLLFPEVTTKYYSDVMYSLVLHGLFFSGGVCEKATGLLLSALSAVPL